MPIRRVPPCGISMSGRLALLNEVLQVVRFSIKITELSVSFMEVMPHVQDHKTTEMPTGTDDSEFHGMEAVHQRV
jgi:hypothetical protein